MKSTKKTFFIYHFFKFLLSWIFILYYNPKIIGKKNIPKNGSIVIAGNHKHLYDQCLTIIATKRMIHYMAKKEYFDEFFTQRRMNAKENKKRLDILLINLAF